MPFLLVLCQWLGRRAVSHASLGTYLAIPSTGITIIFFFTQCRARSRDGARERGEGGMSVLRTEPIMAQERRCACVVHAVLAWVPIHQVFWLR